MKQYVNLFDYFRDNPNTPIVLKAEDLMIFSQNLIISFREEFERQVRAKKRNKEEDFLLPENVTSTYHISRSTLYRLAKSNLLIPVWVGGQRRYRRRDVEAYINKKEIEL